MTKNMGSVDKLIRIILACLFIVLYFTGTISGTVGTILLIVGGVFIATSFISFCPLYKIFGISTCKIKN